MAIQQMALMAYKAPPAGGGGDSAYLEVAGFDGGVQPGEASITFNPLGDIGKVEYAEALGPNLYTWKTGPNPASSYEVQYTQTSATGDRTITGSTVNAWNSLASSGIPNWTLATGVGTSTSVGYLAIRNASTLVELANVFIQMATNNGV